MYATAHDLITHLRHPAAHRARKLPVPIHTLLTNLLSGAALTAAAHTIPAANPAPPATAVTAQAPPGWQPPDQNLGRHPSTPTARTAAATTATAGGTLTYQVQRGDRLGDIAERFLGDFNDYPQLQAANRARIPDPHGRHGPDHIAPGWQLTLPAAAVDHGPRRHATGTTTPFRPAPPASPAPPQPPTTTPVQPPPAPATATPAPGPDRPGQPPATTPPTVPKPTVPNTPGTPTPTPATHPARPAGINVPDEWLSLSPVSLDEDVGAGRRH